MNKPPTGSDFASRLLAWFEDFGRHDLPWQREPTAYRVWVSEIMLQQTQVKTVIPYFERFMARFPNVSSLASATIDDVLHLWSGLGYYARGRNLHRAAGIVMSSHGGELPRDMDALVALPGIGRSTAGAILALAHGQRHPILDGNVKRVLSRQACIDAAPSESATQKLLWQFADDLTPVDRVAEYTQAIMDLGATLCTRREPSCQLCPVSNSCLAFRRQIQHEYPARKSKKALPIRRTQFLIARFQNDEVILEQRPPSGIWGGLWCFPDIGESGSAEQWCRHQGLEIDGEVGRLDLIKHAFTHFKLEIEPVVLSVTKKACALMDQPQWLWYNVRERPPLGIAKPTAALLSLIEEET